MAQNNLVKRVKTLEDGHTKAKESISNIERDLHMLTDKTEQNRLSNLETAKIAGDTHKFLIETKSEIQGAWKVFKFVVIPMSVIVIPVLYSFINNLLH